MKCNRPCHQPNFRHFYNVHFYRFINIFFLHYMLIKMTSFFCRVIFNSINLVYLLQNNSFLVTFQLSSNCMYLRVNFLSELGDAHKICLIHVENFECHMKGGEHTQCGYKRAHIHTCKCDVCEVVFEREPNKRYTATFLRGLCMNLLGIFPTERFMCVYVCMDDAGISYAGEAIV